MEDKKILILTMSCNQPYFQALLGAVKNTWAKPLIRNKYPNVMWYSYTACDEKHPKPVIDFENNMIYVDCKDDLHHTYEKTQKAYNMIKDALDFNYVVRTNASVFINVDNLIKYVSEINEDDVIANYNLCTEDLEDGTEIFRFWCLIGFFMGMKKEYFDIAMDGDEIYIRTSKGEISEQSYDDCVISQKLNDALGPDYNIVKINPNGKVVMYKPCNEGDEVAEPHKNSFIIEYNNPDVINNQILVRVRSFHDGEDRIEKGHEIEHMYELYDALD